MESVLFFLVYIMAIQAIAIGVLVFSNTKLWVELKAMKQSTHTLTYIDPLTQSFQKPPEGKEQADMFTSPLENI